MLAETPQLSEDSQYREEMRSARHLVQYYQRYPEVL